VPGEPHPRGLLPLRAPRAGDSAAGVAWSGERGAGGEAAAGGASGQGEPGQAGSGCRGDQDRGERAQCGGQLADEEHQDDHVDVYRF
jgi:hypothetical protein